MSKEKVLITSALLYANGTVHFGHIAGAYLSADVFARFERMRGKDVLFVSGSDEYGVAITFSAERAGRTPQEHVDHFHPLNKKIFEELGISFDHYGRTTSKGHAKPVQEYFEQLKKNGFVEERETKQLYCENEDRFLADRYVMGTCPRCGYENARGDECPKCGGSYEATDLKDPLSRISKSPLALKTTRHWFLLLDKLASKLEEWVAKKNWRPNVLNFVKSYLKELHPRAITRDGSWGIPVPGSEGKVFYVWFEACIGYLSISQEWDERWRDFWLDPETRLVQFVGKDNIFFHGIFFPAMTIGQDHPYKTVDNLPANEFLNLEGHQFSKTEGWFIDIEDFLTRYSSDQIRYTLAANAPESSDSEFTWHDFQMRCNAELLGKYGNLANRVLVFTQKQAEGKIPPLENPSEHDQTFLADIERIKRESAEHYSTFSTRRACQAIMELAHIGNQYFDSKQPWKAPDKLNTIHCSLECLKTLAIISAPVIPHAAEKLWEMLGYTSPLTEWKQDPLTPGTPLHKPEILVRKVEDEEIEREVAKLPTP